VPPTPPAAPSGLVAAAAGDSQVNLTWTDGSDNESSFKIERCTGDGCSDFAQIATTAANATSYSNTGLAASTSYTYRVRASNSGGDSPFSNTSSATTDAPPPPPPAPNAPSSLTAGAAGQTQINLAWTDNSDNETGFKIERCTGVGCGSFAQIATVGANVTTYSNTGLSSGTSYSYRVRANNGITDSPFSNTASATTASPPPDAPPVARYTWSCTAKGGKECSFNGTSSTDDKGISSYSWNFGDGTTGTGSTVTHRYGASGSRNVTLTVKDTGNQNTAKTCSVANGSTGTCGP
jgi:chitodextrinase